MTQSPPKRGRPPGRPSGQVDLDQRQRLLDIALRMFAREGIAETTLAAIAREAEMTPAAVHYYFKTREQLFDVLFVESIEPMRQRIGSVFLDNATDPVAAITGLVERFMAVAEENPWVGSMWFRELISENSLLKDQMRRHVGGGAHLTVIPTIRRWQDEGLVSRDLDPALLVTSVLSLTMLPMTAARKWREDPLRKHIDAAVIARHALALLTHGIAPAGATLPP